VSRSAFTWDNYCVVSDIFPSGDIAMPIGRPKAELVVTEAERAHLSAMARSRSLSAALSMRAKIVLASVDGETNSSIAARLGLTKATVGSRP
jgi:putative transposase